MSSSVGRWSYSLREYNPRFLNLVAQLFLTIYKTLLQSIWHKKVCCIEKQHEPIAYILVRIHNSHIGAGDLDIGEDVKKGNTQQISVGFWGLRETSAESHLSVLNKLNLYFGFWLCLVVTSHGEVSGSVELHQRLKQEGIYQPFAWYKLSIDGAQLCHIKMRSQAGVERGEEAKRKKEG
jgi:hypothetical protein